MHQNKIILILSLLFFLVSCQTNKEPLWVSNPPPDDALNIYVVGHGVDDGVYLSVVDQLVSRFKLSKSDYFSNMIIYYLNNVANTDFQILDRYSGKNEDYILVRIKRSFFDPVLNLYRERFDEMNSFIHEDESVADSFYKNGELYNSYLNYLKALEKMLTANDEYYTPSILHVIDKIKNILGKIEISEVETFEKLTIKAPVARRLFFRVLSDEKLSADGFRFRVSFNEGWNDRSRTAVIPVKDNSLEFIPPIPQVSGETSVRSLIDLEDLLSILSIKSDNIYLNYIISEFGIYVSDFINSSDIGFIYKRESDLEKFQKVIYFDNPLITEGVIRYMLEIDGLALASPVKRDNNSLLTFVRNINSITGNMYKYGIFEDKISREIIPFDEQGIMIKISGSFNLVDLETAEIIETQTIKSEFLGINGEEDLADLDFGLKIGEIISGMKF